MVGNLGRKDKEEKLIYATINFTIIFNGITTKNKKITKNVIVYIFPFFALIK